MALSEKDSASDLKESLPVAQNKTPQVTLDTGLERLRYRKRWFQLWLPKNPPPPPPASLDDAKTIPLANAGIISQLTYTWINDIMVLGYQRTLQATDLWKMDESRQVETVTAKLDEAWNRRVQEAAKWNASLTSGEVVPGRLRRLGWHLRALGRARSYANSERHWREVDARTEASLAWALNDTFGWGFWIGGAFKVCGDTMQLMGPLLVKAIINFAKEKQSDGPDPNIGRGIGMAIGLFLLTALTSVCNHQASSSSCQTPFFWRSMTTGVLARGALTASIYKRGVMFSPASRNKTPNAVLVNFISSDVSRIDACSQWFVTWTAPIQATVCLIILLVQLGPSALAGFSLFLLLAPIQERVMAVQFNVRKESTQWTDKRAKLLMEILGMQLGVRGMRIVKYFTYEIPFLQRIFDIRKRELVGVRKIQFARSFNVALGYSVPVLAASLSFITYTSTNNSFDPAIIFASFSLFQLLRQPLMFMPRALSAITDAKNAIVRLQEVFHSEVMDDSPIAINPNQKPAVKVVEASFEWEETPRVAEAAAKGKSKSKELLAAAVDSELTLPERRPFRMSNISLEVARGSLVGIVGPVGSGKSSFLQGLLGEMRRLEGEVTFGGRVGYCPQTAWVQNATLRDNITFGQPWDEQKYWKVIENACLLPDFDVLPAGDFTEIGEKGINLSGGQKQRVSIARALYFDADIVLLDDPLSAVDAHVGRALFTNAICDALCKRGKTVLLVTHALHLLPECDYIYTLSGGRIAEQGTYEDLVAHGGEFARLAREFGGNGQDHPEGDEDGAVKAAPRNTVTVEDMIAKAEKRAGGKDGKLEGRLIVAEKRTTGSVPWKIYWEYLRAGNGYITGPLVVLFMLIMQGCQVMNSYTLVWWQANTFDRSFGFYQLLYGMLGLGQAVFTFSLGLGMDVLAFYVSKNLHHAALRHIFHAKMSFFDTTPAGRIVGVFGKDIDSIDNQLPVSMRLFVLTLANVTGSVILITVLEYYFIIAAFVIFIGYSYFAAFYRASARELKRLDAMLRSLLYAHFSESLTGLSTIRSYGEIPRFVKENRYFIDLENRALFLTVTNQRWLAIRLDFLGAIMVFSVAVFAVVGVSGISAAQIGLVLTYTTTLTQLCGLVTRQSAEVENYMNSVERVVSYSRGEAVESEAPHEKPDVTLPPSWPSTGAVEFRDVVMSYRPGLPNVLKGINLDIKGGERIGIVGRTGAGKSSLTSALYRLVELNSGSIAIDGIDVSTLGLRDLRSQIAIIPQDPLLFSGTIRSNLDPFSKYDDARLWDALRRSYLLPAGESQTSLVEDVASDDITLAQGRFDLDSPVESDGANLSVGERSLLSLARALVKESKIVVLDEATASVDLETDSKIQVTIQTQFHGRTLLCIAHRLRTILSYDRILVLDDGKVAEFDTPSSLYAKSDSVFHGMCAESGISAEDIETSRALSYETAESRGDIDVRQLTSVDLL
ncbi:ABC protein [Amylostereum chailletii]|nr:ABC protein [Amylostereum chailletii]